MDVFDLVAKITLDSSEYDQSLGKAGDSLEDFGRTQSNPKNSPLKSAAAFSALAVASSKVASSLWSTTKEQAAYGDNIDKMSQKMNMSAEAYQEWDFIMQHNGTTMESLKASMKTLATAAENGNEAFKLLGITQEEIASLDSEELFSKTITALQNVQDDTQRTYIAGKLLGRGATELGALLNMTAEDTEAMRQQIHELGGIMSDEGVKAAAAFQDSQQNLDTSLQGLKNTLAEQILPVASQAMDGLSGLAGEITEFADEHPKMVEAFGAVAGSVSLLGAALGTIGAAKKSADFLGLTDAFKSVKTWASGAATSVGDLAVALSGGSLIAGLGLIAGMAAPVAAGIYEIGRSIKETQEIGYLGDGHEYREYADNVAYWEAEIVKAQQEIDALAASGGALDGAYAALDDARIGLKHAQEELDNSGGESLDRWQRYTEQMRPLADETIAMQEERAEAAQEAAAAEQMALEAMAEAYDEAYQSAYSSISGQLGLFNEFTVDLAEDVDTGAEMIQRWGEQAQALGEYTENLKKASEYGLTDGLIQALSDGSAESATALATIIADIESLGDSTEGAGDGAAAMVKQFNEAYQSVGKAKEAFADTAAMLEAGQAQGEALAQGLEGTAGTNASAAETVSSSITDPISALPSSMYSYGSHMGGNLASGLMSQYSAVSSAAYSLASAAAAPLQHTVPKEGPLMHDDEWGYHMMDNFIAGIEGSRDRLHSALGDTLDFGFVSVGGMTATTAPDGGVLGQVVTILTTYLPQILARPIALDDGTIIGRYVPQIDMSLGDTYAMDGRRLAT